MEAEPRHRYRQSSQMDHGWYCTARSASWRHKVATPLGQPEVPQEWVSLQGRDK